MPQDETTLDPRQQAAIRALVAGTTVTNTARTVAVARTTVHRWLRQADFLDALEEAKAEMAEAARGQLRSLAASAIEALKDTLTQTEDVAVRARVALDLVKGLGLLHTGRREDEEGDASCDFSLRQFWRASGYSNLQLSGF